MGSKMKTICPNCEKVSEVELIQCKENIVLGNETIEVDAEYYECLECHENFDDPKSENDPLEKAYEIYYQRTGTKWKGIMKDISKEIKEDSGRIKPLDLGKE